jgi:hypothetical protein
MAVTGIKTAADVEAAKSASTSTAISDSKNAFNNMETFLTLSSYTVAKYKTRLILPIPSELLIKLVMYAQA